MKYEGKIYGKIGGKYIQLDYPQDLMDFVKKLNKELDENIANAIFAAGDFQVRQMDASYMTSMAMANAYRNVKSIIKEMHPG